jgi:methyltransferase (TIGR00027 family)
MKDNRPSGTALVVALMRAAEKRRPQGERILDDPFAGAVVEAAGLGLLTGSSALLEALADHATLGLVTAVVARHRTIDEWLLQRVRADGVRAVVNLGSGFDARAWRLASDLRGIPWFEVDHPATLARKREIFARAVQGAAPAQGYREVAVDFEKDDLLARLLASGLDRSAPVFVVWEGVSMYLERGTVEATFATLSRGLGKGTCVAFDFFEPQGGVRLRDIYGHLLSLTPGLIAEPVKTLLGHAELTSLLARVGLRLEQALDAREMAARVGVEDRPCHPALRLGLATRVALPGET